MCGLWWFYMVREFIEGVGYIKANFLILNGNLYNHF